MTLSVTFVMQTVLCIRWCYLPDQKNQMCTVVRMHDTARVRTHTYDTLTLHVTDRDSMLWWSDDCVCNLIQLHGADV